MEEATTPQQELPAEISKLVKLAADKLAGKGNVYANNASFEASVWDLKITFGELQLNDNTVNWHTAVTIPWLQAKIMAYYLLLNVAFHEQANGALKLSGMKPQRPQPPTEEQITRDPNSVLLFEMAEKLYSQTFGS